MIVRRRSRIRIAVAVIVCLLFQQVAMAAYACTMVRMPAAAVTMDEDCADMGMAKDMARESAALCAKHCSPDRSVAADQVVLGVPALALPVAFDLVLATRAAKEAPTQHVPIDRSDPPPRLRYCSLLI